MRWPIFCSVHPNVRERSWKLCAIFQCVATKEEERKEKQKIKNKKDKKTKQQNTNEQVGMKLLKQ